MYGDVTFGPITVADRWVGLSAEATIAWNGAYQKRKASTGPHISTADRRMEKAPIDLG